MTRQLAYSIVADGGTDRALDPIIRWAIHRLDPEAELLEAQFQKRRGSVSDFLSTYRTGSMLIFVHRDAENVPRKARLQEFDGIDRDDFVPVIPVRMTEAWLLIDAAAIAKAAGYPERLPELPSVGALEGLANPKAVLEDLLFECAGPLTGRRRKRFASSLVSRRVNVSSLIADFSALLALESFAAFVGDLEASYPYRSS